MHFFYDTNKRMTNKQKKIVFIPFVSYNFYSVFGHTIHDEIDVILVKRIQKFVVFFCGYGSMRASHDDEVFLNYFNY